MSYSRWGASRWYTFWHVQQERTENRDTSIFDICAVKSFTAKELRRNMDGCVKITEEIENKKCKPKYKVVEKDLKELRRYMQSFLNDVDNEYPEEL